jgi:hypothetical protein
VRSFVNMVAWCACHACVLHRIYQNMCPSFWAFTQPIHPYPPPPHTHSHPPTHLYSCTPSPSLFTCVGHGWSLLAQVSPGSDSSSAEG